MQWQDLVDTKQSYTDAVEPHPLAAQNLELSASQASYTGYLAADTPSDAPYMGTYSQQHQAMGRAPHNDCCTGTHPQPLPQHSVLGQKGRLGERGFLQNAWREFLSSNPIP